MSADRETSPRESIVTLSNDDLLLLNNALNEILGGPGAIDEWEFQLRTGVEREDAVALLKRIGAMLDAAGPYDA